MCQDKKQNSDLMFIIVIPKLEARKLPAGIKLYSTHLRGNQRDLLADVLSIEHLVAHFTLEATQVPVLVQCYQRLFILELLPTATAVCTQHTQTKLAAVYIKPRIFSREDQPGVSESIKETVVILCVSEMGV